MNELTVEDLLETIVQEDARYAIDAYHFVREGSAADEWRISYIDTHANVADLMTKVLTGGEKRTRLVRKILWHI